MSRSKSDSRSLAGGKRQLPSRAAPNVEDTSKSPRIALKHADFWGACVCRSFDLTGCFV